MPIVRFVNEKKEIEVPVGANLRKEAIRAGINLYSRGTGVVASLKANVVNCHGWGHCGTCRVLVTQGMENTNDRGLAERLRFHCPLPDPASLGFIGNEETMRLACKTTVHGDIEVTTGPELNLFGENFFS